MTTLFLTVKQQLFAVLSLLAFCLPAAAGEEGFHPLFDGKSLLGWTLMHGQGPGYVAEDGLLFCPADGGGNLFTKEQFGDFIFRFDFKLEAGGNNGVGIRTPLEGNPAYQGMEIQILDDHAEKYANLRPAQYHGSIYDVFPAKRGALKKGGEWNEEEISCKGSKVRITLNGQVIVDADLATVKDPEVLKAHPGLKRTTGHIGFLGHGSNVWFRNIRIKDLRLNVPPESFIALFNGRDLTGWKGLVKDPPARAKMSPEELAAAQGEADERMREHWKVEDGILVFDGKGDSLCTDKDFSDFELYVDWKILPRGDSGIYLRGSPQVQIWDNDVGSGGLYNNQKNPSKPSVKADNLIGEWNRFRIIMIGEKVTVYLNGRKVVDHVTMENYWERDKPIYPTGAIELQNHGNTLYFRNIFVREIEGGPEKKGVMDWSDQKAFQVGAVDARGREPLGVGFVGALGWQPSDACAIGAGSRDPIKVGIVDVEDHWLKAKGLAKYLDGAGIACRDLTDEVRSGEVELGDLDALLIGSFATADPAVREGLDRNKDAIRAFILEGGVVAEFTQADQEQDGVDWLPPPLKARRCDLDHARPFLPDPGHPLLSGLGSADLLNCAFPGKAPFWETFSEHEGFAVLGAADEEGDAPFLLEGAAGEGRILLFSMTPDKALAMEDSVKKKRSAVLLGNLIEYIRTARDGGLPPVEPDDLIPYAVIAVTGVVFEDLDRDGTRDPDEPSLKDITVSNGIDVVRTDRSGAFRLEMPLERTRCLFPVIPADFEVPGNVYFRIPDREQRDRRVAFGLVRREEPPPEAFTIVQTTDIHVGRLSLAALAEDVAEINRLDPQPHLVFATGDLVETGTIREQYEGYAAAMADLHAPLVNVIGNHDYNGGENRTRNWERHLGPRYFSFDFGPCHVLCLDSVDFDETQQAWIEKDISAAGRDRPVLIFQHYLPTGEQLDLFARYNTRAVFSGHWHGTRESRYQGMLNVNSATLRFGGIDRTARGFRMARMENGSLSLDYRVGGVDHHLAVVSPQPGAVVARGRIPVVVNAYDTAVPPDRVVVAVRHTGPPLRQDPDMDLESKGNWSWFGLTDCGEIGEKLLLATATDRAGRSWRSWSSFRVADLPAPAVEPGADWPMFHGDAGNTGRTEGELRTPLSLAWVAHTGGGVNIGSPVVYENRVYIGTLFLHNFDDCAVVCLDARTGRLIWRSPTDSSIKHAPCVADGRVFAASVTGTLHAFGAGTGEELWKAALGSEDVQRWDTCAPKCAEGVVYAGRGGYFAALDGATGAERWRAEDLDGNWWPNVYASPAIGEDRIFLGARTGLFALDRATGERLWHVKEASSSPVFDGERLFALLQGGLAEVDPATGEIRWRSDALYGDETGCPALSGGPEPRLYAGGADGRMTAFSAADGDVLADFAAGPGIASQRPYQRGERTISSSPALTRDFLLFGGNDGYFYVLDRLTLAVRQRFYIGAPIPASPAVSGNAVFVAAYDGNVYAFSSAR